MEVLDQEKEEKKNREELELSIKKFLPNITEDVFNKLISCLEMLGVEKVEDFEHLHIEQLTSALPFVKASILLKGCRQNLTGTLYP